MLPDIASIRQKNSQPDAGHHKGSYPETFRQVTPRYPGPITIQNSFYKQTVIFGGTSRQKVFDAFSPVIS